MSERSMPNQARVVIVGGGIMGCGLAYHLAHEGWSDVVLLEKAELTSGSTWHAAGQITHSTSSFGLGKCVDYNIGLYAGALEAETGQSVTWHGTHQCWGPRTGHWRALLVACSPNTAAMASASARSPTPVEVPCALM